MKSLLIILYIGLLFLIFFGLPDYILYNQGIVLFIPWVLVFIIQPLLLFFILKSFKVSRKNALGFVAASCLIIGPALGFYEGHRANAAFKSKGSLTKGIVYKKWQAENEWLLRCQYNVDGKAYSTFTETDDDNRYEVGDTLTIIYIKDFPQKCIIKELE